MATYLLRRLLLIVPTLFGIVLINFLVIQLAPGGPVEQVIARYTSTSDAATQGRLSSGGAETLTGGGSGDRYRGARGLNPDFIKKLEVQFGYDKPLHERFFKMVGDFLRFDLGTSFFQGRPVLDLILDKLPVSISLGLWTTLLIYLISIPLGIAKAVRDGSRFDIWTSGAIVLGYAIPSFLIAVLLIVLFAGGSFWSVFPLRGLVSEGFDSLSLAGKIGDYAWHMALPVISMVLGGFATLTLLTKNSFIDEIGKQYVTTARAKGLSEGRILYGHVFRNAMLIIIAGFPAAFIGILFTSSLLIEVIFSLDGLGLLGFQAAEKRDYPIIFGTLYLFSLIGLLTSIVSDLTYTLVDPRIDFERRG
ncbi:microcin C ABC transporter permease YejB [Zavarzinia compransoris]|uniref:Microcin ABC transporter permease n=1 Tax=Zavarzinia compransoris TaxID=1264899 RepID=A0A317E6D8_9PROT|nr:microcin C ABC transporter permease YejB [Zavarzinia compransoris]PWR21800.1 microcin ABC transporter permease [Zavarzinia compransoris]TDP45401.1 microcin C transport system permease protein [Zavarzinia compransoris]